MQLNFAIEINFYFVTEKYQYTCSDNYYWFINSSKSVENVRFLSHRITRRYLSSFIKCLCSILFLSNWFCW